MPIRTEMVRLRSMHLFVSRKKGTEGSRAHLCQRIEQLCEIARETGIRKRIYPRLLRNTIATRLLAVDTDIADIQKLLGHAYIRRS